MAIEELLGQLTLEEKCSLLSGSAFWYTQAVERLGIRRRPMLHAVRNQAKLIAGVDHLLPVFRQVNGGAGDKNTLCCHWHDGPHAIKTRL